jgi:hypothetical protein
MTAFDEAWEIAKEEEEDTRSNQEKFDDWSEENNARASMRDLSHLPQIIGPIRYYETRRGVAYEAPTEHGLIYNDGHGGATFFDHTTEEGKAFRDVHERDWEDLIIQHESKAHAQAYGGE